MKTFAETFFKHFGAHVSPHEDELVVNLPPDLADVFGKPRLYLVFPEPGKTRDLTPGEDLLAYGSRTFDQMLTVLKDRGQAAYLDLPVQFAHPAEGQDLSPLPLYNCQTLRNYVTSHQDLFYVFNFRAAYVSDEKQEEFVTVVLDVEGRPQPDVAGMLANLDFAQLPTFQPLQFDAHKLRQMLDLASQAAHERADARAAELEKTIQPRLEKVLLRLARYYRRLMEEVKSDDPAQDDAVRADLQRDLSRQIADELERHRLRVTLVPISYALAQVPFARHQLTLRTRHTQQIVQVGQNLHTGQVAPVLCHHCGEAVERLALCDHGHPVHPDCLSTCHRCERDVCHTCGVQPCAMCNQRVCADCVARCAYCDRWLCASHVQRCAICDQAFCTDHSFRCRLCGQLYCSQHERKGKCDTCRSALSGPIIDAARIAWLEPGYAWRQAKNQAYTIYVGRRSLWRRLIIVTDKSGQVIHREEIGSLRGLYDRWR
jgi:hypothetical protein